MPDRPILVLYVDDYPLDRALVRDALLSDVIDFDLVEASSRQEFDALLLAKKYDLVLSDFNILGFTGLQVLDAVQENLPGTPVIIVTGTGSEEVAAEAIKRGAADYVIKSPSHIRRLPHIIKSALDQQRLRNDRQRAQQDLQESERRFQLLFEEAPIGYQSLDSNRRILLVNERWTKMLGYSKEEVIGKDFNDIVAPKHKEYQKIRFGKFLAAGEIQGVELPLVCQDGSQILVEFNGVIGYDKQGNFLQTHCTLNDITQRKRVEQRLMAQRKDYETIIDAMPNLIWYLDPDGKVLRANKAVVEMVGLPFDELIGKTGFDLFPNYQAEKFHKDNLEVLQSKKPILGIIEEYQTPSGEMRWAQTDKLPYTDPDGAVLGVIVIAQDITDRQHAEEARARYTRQLEALHQTGLGFAQLQDPVAIGEWVLSTLDDLLNYQRGALVVKDPLTGDLELLAHARMGLNEAEYQAELIRLKGFLRKSNGLIRYAIENGESLRIGNVKDDPLYIEAASEMQSEMVVPMKTGGVILGAINVESSQQDAFSHEDERLLSTLASQAAIALQNASSAEAIRQSEVTYRKLFEGANDGIFLLDLNGIHLGANQKALDMMGYELDELIGMSFHQVVDTTEVDNAEGVLQKLLDGQEVATYERKFIRRNGESFPGEVNVSLVYDDQAAPRYLQSIVRDITNRKFYESELLRHHEELRILASRLAEAEENERRRLSRELHDQVGQSLAVLGFNLNIVREQMTQANLTNGLSSVVSSITLVDDVSQSIRGVMDDLRPSVLDDYGLFSAISWYADRYSEQTGIKTQVEGKSMETRLSGSIENALFRITQEALTNVTRHAKAELVTISLRGDQDHIELVISDNGTGFEESVPQEIGQRRGWGLVNMRERAEAIGGEMRFESVLNKGTVIKVRAPKG